MTSPHPRRLFSRRLPDNGLGADTLVLQSAPGTNFANASSAIILLAVDSDDLVAGNFIA